ncbi:MAG: DUF2891 domain-containing protein [Candidatus Limnocylindria bacterium]
MDWLTPDLAARMAMLAVENIGREFPNAPGHRLDAIDDMRRPRELHPAFFGSYDWHSSVHQHWLLVRLLRLERAGTAATDARSALGAHLTAANLSVEATYLRDRPAFERTYGWAWLLKLADELDAWTDPDATAWRTALEPAVDAVRGNWLAHLPNATYPIRAGTHANSAFGLLFGIRHGRNVGYGAFESALAGRATAWFADDVAAPAHLEPGGDDFLSSTLIEAAAVAELFGRQAFAAWFTRFLPAPPTTLTEPVTVTDRSDPKIAHLDGLNLSRAWCWKIVAEHAGRDDAKHAADRHLEASIPHLFSGEFAAEHWVTSFALLALSPDVPGGSPGA